MIHFITTTLLEESWIGHQVTLTHAAPPLSHREKQSHLQILAALIWLGIELEAENAHL